MTDKYDKVRYERLVTKFVKASDVGIIMDILDAVYLLGKNDEKAKWVELCIAHRPYCRPEGNKHITRMLGKKNRKVGL